MVDDESSGTEASRACSGEGFLGAVGAGGIVLEGLFLRDEPPGTEAIRA